jgi:PAS domain S-box-containing protein
MSTTTGSEVGLELQLVEKLEHARHQILGLKTFENQLTQMREQIVLLRNTSDDFGQLEWILRESQCLRDIADVAESPDSTLDEICQKVVKIIPEHCRYPESACSRVIVSGKEFRSDNYEETQWKQSANLEANNKSVGQVEISYLKERPAIDERPFSTGEAMFITAVARWLGRIIEHKLAEVVLVERVKELESFEWLVKEAEFLSAIADVAEGSQTTLDEIYQHAVNLIPKSYKYPNIARSRIVVNGKEFRTANYKDTKWNQSADIVANGELIGKIKVTYLEERLPIDEGPFSKSERMFINAAARRLGQITERRMFEAHLQESIKQYRMVAENSADVICLLDMNLKPAYISPSITQLVGYTVDEAMNRTVEESLTDSSVDVAKKALARAVGKADSMKGEGDVPYIGAIELEMKHKSGSTVWAESTVSLLCDPGGKAIGLLCIVRNIAERKRKERERRELERRAELASRLASVNTMASRIAREIDDPLSIVVSFTNLLLQKDIPQDIKGDVETIGEATRQVVNTVQRLMSFARQDKPIRTRANINDVIESTLALLSSELKKNNIKVVTRLEPGLSQTLADPALLQQVFLEIITNAERQMKSAHDKGSLFVKTEKVDSIIRVSFKDDGPGIAEESLETIFDPFAADSDKKSPDKTELGLSFCRKVATEHGGRLYAQSRLGQGATFVVELPIVNYDEQTQVSQSADETCDARR